MWRESRMLIQAFRGNINLIKDLAEVSANHEDGGITPLHLSTHYRDIEAVKTCIAAGADVNVKDVMGITPLHLSAHNGNVEVVKALIAAGAKVNKKSEDGITPLHLSAHRGNVDVVKTLIAAGAKVNAKDIEGITPLHKSTFNGTVDVVKALIDAGADVNAKDKYGNAALHESADNGDVDVVKALIVAGADVNVKDTKGRTPLHNSVHSDVDVVKALIAAGANVNEKNKKGKTPLHYSRDISDVRIVRILISAGADAGVADKKGNTSLDVSIKDEVRKEIIKYTLLYETKGRLKINSEQKHIFKEFWNKCENQIKIMKETCLGRSGISFFKFLRETDNNKLALYSSEEYFGINNDSGRMSYIENFSVYTEDVEAQFKKGSERANLLHKSYELMTHFFCYTFPPEINRKICECMTNDDLLSFLVMNDIF